VYIYPPAKNYKQAVEEAMKTSKDDEAVITYGLTFILINTVEINRLPLPPILPE
jgi:hypothetical protein